MNEKINTQDLIALLAEKSGITKKEAEAFLKECFDTVGDTLISDQLVKIKNLGSFKLTLVNDRESVDVATGNRVLIPAHYKANYSPDNSLAQKINEPFSLFESVEINEENEENESNEGNEKINERNGGSEEGEKIDSNRKEIEIEKTKPIKKNRHKKANHRKVYRSLFIALLLIIVGAFYYFNSHEINELFSEFFSPTESTLDFTTHNKIEISKQEPVIVEPDTTVAEETPVKETVKDSVVSIPKEKEIVAAKVAPVSSTPKPEVNETAVVQSKKRTIQSNERLTLIALEEYGSKIFWVYLYEENKSIIKNPNNVPVGLTITIPPAHKYSIDKNDEESIRRAELLGKQYVK